MQNKKHRLLVFSGQGDTAVAEWEVGDEESTEIARGVFEQAKRDGFAAVTPAEGGARRVDSFEPGNETTFLLRPIARVARIHRAESRAGQVVRLLAPETLAKGGDARYERKRHCTSMTFGGLDSDEYIPETERWLTKYLYWKHFRRRYNRVEACTPNWVLGQHNLKPEDKKLIK